MKCSSLIIVGMVSASLAFWIAIVTIHKKSAHVTALKQVKAVIPEYFEKIQKTVAVLQAETPLHSVRNLYYVTDYYNPGAPSEWITDENRDEVELDSIVSNRRFRKVLSELGSMDKTAATQIVKTNLLSALTNYSRLYEEQMRLNAPHFRVSETNTPKKKHLGVAFVITPQAGHEDEETLLGEKLKVLSLVWISGMLRLSENQEEVGQAVRLALMQKRELETNLTLKATFRDQMLETASLCNRQALGSALCGVVFKDDGAASNVMKAAGIHWQERTLAAYDAALTEFDKPALSGILAPDRSTGALKIKFVSRMNNTNFDILLREMHFQRAD
jgi:hypothetical protein